MESHLNINLDDVHPESGKHIADCGGDMEKGVFKYIVQLIDEFPKLKFTLFVTPNWIYKPGTAIPIRLLKRFVGLQNHNTWIGEPFRLDKHKEWCVWLNNLVKKGNIEIAVHGLYHHNTRFPYSAEFRDLPYEECKKRLILAEKIFEEAELIYTKGFRPPGWGLSEGLFEALKELGYSYISLDPIACGISTEELPRHSVSIYKGLINVPQNWDVKRGRITEAIGIIKKYGLLSAKGHIQDRYGRDNIGNGLTEESYENIRNLLLEIEKEGIRVKFATLEEIANESKRLFFSTQNPYTGF